MATSLGSLRSSTQYPSSSSTIHGFCIYTYFYYEVLEPGKTKVTWSFQAGYDNYGSYPATSTYASAGITISLSATKGSISEITGTSYSGSGIRYKNWPTLSSGGCVITHDASGEASFNVYADVSVGGWDCDSSTSFTVPTNIPYTACGAPTTVSASGIVAPDGSFTISWSGATNGVSNKIKSYQVFWYATSSDNITPILLGTAEVDVADGTTSGSYTVKLNNATRGHKITCGVKALSSLDSAYDSGTKTGGSVVVNSLPAAPSVSVNKTIVPSTNGQVTFTITAGSDADSGQTRTLYYATSASGSKTKVTSPWSPTVTATTTYYFWTYDGLEFSSSSTSKKITKNTKPEITSVVIDESEILDSVNKVSGYSYLIKPKITVTSKNGQDSKKYNYYIDYGPTASLGSRVMISMSDSAATKTIRDVRVYDLNHSSSGAYYRITVKCNDGIEDSGEKWSKTYYITKRPALKGVYNKSNYDYIPGYYINSKATHFSNYLGFKFERDQGYTSLKITGNNSFTKTISLTTTSEYTQGSFTETNPLSSNILYTLKLSLGVFSQNVYLYHSGSFSYSITRIGIPILDNLNAVIKHKYFTSKSTYSGSVRHSFGTSPVNGALINFGLSSALTNYFKISIIRGSKQKELSEINISKNSNDNDILFSIPYTSLNAAGELFNSEEKNYVYNNLELSIKIINDFGDIITVKKNAIITFDFIEDSSIEIGPYKIYPTDNSDNPINKWMYLTEGMGSLFGEFTIYSYNTNPKGEIQFKRSMEDSWISLVSFDFKKVGDDNASPGFRNTYKSPEKVWVQTISEIITNEYTVSYQLIVTTDAPTPTSEKKVIELYNEIPVRGHTAPTLNIKNTSYTPPTDDDSSGVIKIEYEIIDWGASTDKLSFGEDGDNELSLYIEEEEGQTVVSCTLDTPFANPNDVSFNYTIPKEKNSVLVKLGFCTELGTYLNGELYFKTKKEVNRDTLIAFPVFNILPTVAYRKNHLGINILNPSDKKDAIIVIGETDERNAIYFQPAGTNLCQVINFYIDGGDNWGKPQS